MCNIYIYIYIHTICIYIYIYIYYTMYNLYKIRHTHIVEAYHGLLGRCPQQKQRAASLQVKKDNNKQTLTNTVQQISKQLVYKLK